jgi:hypothetical protein
MELQRPARFAMRVITLSRLTTASTKKLPSSGCCSARGFTQSSHNSSGCSE